MAPRLDAGQIREKADRVLGPQLEPRVALSVRDDRAVGSDQLVIDGDPLRIQQMRFDDRPEAEQTVSVRRPAGIDDPVADANFGLSHHSDAACDPGTLLGILVLERRRNGIRICHDAERIASVDAIPRHVEIGGRFRIGEIAGRPAVHINVVGAAHGVEPNEHLPVDPFERQLEVGAVDRRPGPVAPLLGHACDSPLRHVDRGHRNGRIQLDGRRVSLDFPLPVELLYVKRVRIVLAQGQLAAVVAAQPAARHFPLPGGLR